MPKFTLKVVGALPVEWVIEVEAPTVIAAEREALDSAPYHVPANWTLGAEVIGVSIEDVVTHPDEVHDKDLGRRELEEKYMGETCWGHHPIHRRDLWKHCVAVDDTVSSYWDWVYDKVQNEDEPDEAH